MPASLSFGLTQPRITGFFACVLSITLLTHCQKHSEKAIAPQSAFQIENQTIVNANFTHGLNTPYFQFLGGSDGTIIYAQDNNHWKTANTLGTTANINCLASSNDGNTLIASGENGTLLYSENKGTE